MPASFATMKWPNSWKTMTGPRTRTAASSVVSTGRPPVFGSNLKRRSPRASSRRTDRVDTLARGRPGARVGDLDGCQIEALFRPAGRGQGRGDDVRDVDVADALREQRRHRDLVGGV